MTAGEDTQTSLEDEAASARGRRWRRLKLKLIFLFLSFVLSLAVGEIAARRYWHPHPDLTTLHHLCWHMHPPNLDLPMTGPDGDWSFTTDPFGFRGASVATATVASDAVRIIFVGGSTTEAINIPEEETFVGKVESDLAKRRGTGDPRVEVANAGVFGFNSAACYSQLVHRVLPLHPDIVFLMVAINDLRMSLDPEFDEDNLFFVDRETYGFSDWLCDASMLARGGRSLLLRLHLISQDPPDVDWRRKKPVMKGVDMSVGLGYYKRYLHLFALACRDAGARLVLMTEPSIYKDLLSPEEDRKLWMMNIGEKGPNCDVQEFRKGLGLYNQAVRDAARDEQVLLVDLDPIPGDPIVPKSLAYFQDDVHLQPTGHALVEHEILRQVFGTVAVRKP